MPKLLIRTGEKKGFVYRLTDNAIYIGRNPTNTIALVDRRVSRAHASIAPYEGNYVIEDLGSVNGTYVNDKIVERKDLEIGDEIKLGSTVLAFLSLQSPENIDGEDGSASKVNIISPEETPKGLTVELTVSSKDSKVVDADFKKEDSTTLHKAYLRLMTLYRISHELGSIVDLQKVLNEILRLVLDITKADRGFIMLVDEETGDLVPQIVRQKGDECNEGDVAISKTIINQIMETGESILVSDAMTDDRFKEAESIVFYGIRSTMCVPLKFNSKILGIMSVDSRGKEVSFLREDLELLTVICDQAAVAIKNAELFGNLKKANEELKAQQNQLIEAEKLSAIGQLSSGVAHEINNPLTSILGYTELSQLHLGKDAMCEKEKKECLEFLKIVQDEAHHCKRIAQSLLQFSRRQKDEMTSIDVNKAIEAALVIAKFHIKSVSIEIEVKLKADIPPIMGDANQLQQVFLNLIINARDSMEKGGKITITSLNIKDKFVEIKFADKGCGIPKDKLEEIFKALYTSKEEGKGTGLGLSISQDIIEKHKGTIEVESTLGKGTTFTIKLPSKDNVMA